MNSKAVIPMAAKHAMSLISSFLTENRPLFMLPLNRKIMRLKQSGYTVVEMWEHDWVRHCKKNKINPKGDLPKLYLEPLIPREAYFGGRVNCTKMLYKCDGSGLLYYMDVTSMYPFVMCAFKFPTGKPDVRTHTGVLPHKHNFLPSVISSQPKSLFLSQK
jgi:hypothetical protein